MDAAAIASLIVTIIGAVISLSSIIVKFTPSPKDDIFLAKVREVLKILSLNVKK